MCGGGICLGLRREVSRTSSLSFINCTYPLPTQALDKAKDAGRKERVLCKQREQAQATDQINLDLTYCVSDAHSSLKDPFTVPSVRFHLWLTNL